MPASDTIKQPVARYQAVSTRRGIPQQLPCPVIPLAVARIDKMVSDPHGTQAQKGELETCVAECQPATQKLKMNLSWHKDVLMQYFLLGILPRNCAASSVRRIRFCHSSGCIARHHPGRTGVERVWMS